MPVRCLSDATRRHRVVDAPLCAYTVLLPEDHASSLSFLWRAQHLLLQDAPTGCRTGGFIHHATAPTRTRKDLPHLRAPTGGRRLGGFTLYATSGAGRAWQALVALHRRTMPPTTTCCKTRVDCFTLQFSNYYQSRVLSAVGERCCGHFVWYITH